MAQFEKGQSGNPAGRPKGTPNKATTTVRAWIMELLNDNREQIQNDLLSLEPAKRLEFIVELLPYVLPKVKTAEEVEGAAYTREDVEVGDTIDWETNRIRKWSD